MEINPQDVTMQYYRLVGSWGISSGNEVILTHTPTGIQVSAINRSAHRAKAKAFEKLAKELSDTHYGKQLELFE